MSTQMAKLFAAAGQAAPEVKYILRTHPGDRHHRRHEMSTQMAKLFAAAGQAAPEVKYILRT
ncbi:hypothetical protein CKJ90_32950, partial [Klebsiella pneumoniae]